MGARRLAFYATAMICFSSGSALASGDSIDVVLKSQHKSGVTANATLSRKGDSTIVVVKIGGGGSELFLPDLRSGTCAHAAAAPEIPLAMASAGSPSETTVDVPLPDLNNGSYVIMLHRLDVNPASLSPKTALACGAVGVHETVANSVAVTGIGPVRSTLTSRWFAAGLTGAALAAAVAWRVQRQGGTS